VVTEVLRIVTLNKALFHALISWYHSFFPQLIFCGGFEFTKYPSSLVKHGETITVMKHVQLQAYSPERSRNNGRASVEH
jgi:hypothetical protein